MTTCLVIGATGFIGGQIARAAAERGWQVRALRRRPQAVGAIGDVPVDWRTGDLADRASLIAAMHGCEVVFHAAGAYPHGARHLAQEIHAAESQVRTVLQAFDAAGAGRLVYTSSFTTLGPP
ncbi:MAG: NAD-dependent epimerase/dehydratase family protein, partial [Anaerolineae bacterium]